MRVLPFLGGGGDDLKRLPLVLILHKLLYGFMVIVYNIRLYIYIDPLVMNVLCSRSSLQQDLDHLHFLSENWMLFSTDLLVFC